ncbi:MAG: tRNA lysidine(34) synthetase TilS [Thermoleophilia bacterium]|nr:tRNA lysidine(34) synthetase TilS [Thermoleophilia bacterium]
MPEHTPDRLLDRVAATAARTGAPAPGEHVLALVSGGPDSTLLMHALAGRHDGPVTVLSVDHGLRAAAAAECARVADAARGLGLPARTERLDLPAGPGAQERARDARYALARRAAAELGCTAIAVGHTRSDQAETVLMRLARGTGRTGALGMAPRAGDLVRPLLEVTAGEAREWCAARGLAVADDPSNADPAYTRVRARRLVAAMEDLHPGAAGHLAAFADALRDEAGLLECVTDAAWSRCARSGGLDAAALAAEPLPVRRVLVRRMLAGAGLGGDATGAAAVGRVLAMAGGPVRAEVAGAAVVREDGVLRVAGAVTAPPPARLESPGEVAFGDLLVRARPGIAAPPRPHRVCLPAGGALVVRPPLPGDRLGLPGGGRARVGRLLADRGVPARLRPLVPVIELDGRPVWVAGHRADAAALAAPGEPATVLEVLR